MRKFLTYLDSLPSRQIVFFLLSLALSIRLIALKVLGPHIGQDSHSYSEAADLLLAHHFNFFFISEMGLPFYYWAYPALLALFSNNPMGVILFQIFLQSLACVLVFFVAKRVFNKAAGLFAATGFAFFFEIFQWDLYILTDSLFISLIVLALFLALQGGETKKRSYLSALVLVILGLLFLRPTTAPLLLALALFWSWSLSWRSKALFFLIGFCVCVFVVGQALQEEQTSQLNVTRYVHVFTELFQEGTVVRARPEFNVVPAFDHSTFVGDAGVFLKIFSMRLMAFWSPWAAGFSLPHQLFNLVTLLPLYLFGMLGILKSFRSKPKDALAKNFIVFFTASILSFWFFHALTEIDYDWRYRTPVFPFLIMFAGYGCFLFLEWIRRCDPIMRRQISRFLVVGLLNASVDYSILNLLYAGLGFSLFWSVFWGFVSGGVVGYFLHSRFTFQYDAHGKEVIKLSHFLLVSIANLAFTESVMHALIQEWDWHYNVAKFLTLLMAVIVSFSASKWWVFKKSRAPVPSPSSEGLLS